MPRKIAAGTIFGTLQLYVNSLFLSLTRGGFRIQQINYMKKRNATKSRPQRLFSHFYLALLVGFSHLPDGKEIGEKSGDYIYTFVFTFLCYWFFTPRISPMTFTFLKVLLPEFFSVWRARFWSWGKSMLKVKISSTYLSRLLFVNCINNKNEHL